MPVAAWIGEATFFPYNFLLWAMTYWYSCEVAYCYWFHRGEVLSEKIKAITSLLLLLVSSFMQVPSGATGHYLLGIIYRFVIHGYWICAAANSHIGRVHYICLIYDCRCTGRMSAASEQFTQALTLDPLLWAAYEELCILGWFIVHSFLKFCSRSILNVIYYSIRST
jgi:hypothetical protein